MYLEKTKSNSIVFLLLFLSPQIIYSVIPKNFVSTYYIILPICYLILLLKNINFFFSKEFLKPLLLSISFVFFGLINLVIHESNAFFNLLAPIVAFMGYCYLLNKKIDLKIFDFFLISMYVFFYFVYFSVLPDLFFRPGFDEDAVVFDNSSSNTIPISLNITLYAYMILNWLYRESNNKKILIFSIINFGLIVIQQSRIGLMISLVLFFMALFDYDKKKMLRVLVGSSILLMILVVTYFSMIGVYIESIGNVSGVEALNEDIRGEAQRVFFKNMDESVFFFGYKGNYIYASGADGNIMYTYNVFLDIWNKYGLFELTFFIVVLMIRFVKHKKFYFPLYFFIPFFLYCLVESIFFPNFCDCIIYILLFTPK